MTDTATTITATATSTHAASAPTKAVQDLSFSLNIWPPTQRTREAVVRRLLEIFTTHSIISNRYGLLSEDVADAAAVLIEEEAHNAAASAAGDGNAGDGAIELLRVYSAEISQRMLEFAKFRAYLKQ